MAVLYCTAHDYVVHPCYVQNIVMCSAPQPCCTRHKTEPAAADATECDVPQQLGISRKLCLQVPGRNQWQSWQPVFNLNAAVPHPLLKHSRPTLPAHTCITCADPESLVAACSKAEGRLPKGPHTAPAGASGPRLPHRRVQQGNGGDAACAVQWLLAAGLLVLQDGAGHQAGQRPLTQGGCVEVASGTCMSCTHAAMTLTGRKAIGHANRE